MPVAVLISDMHGRHGDTRYMTAWSLALSARGHVVRMLFIDELLPEHYRSPDEPAQARHARITSPEAVGLARERLAASLAGMSPDLALGFSYGGYVLAGCRETEGQRMKRVCISATRLRLLLPMAGPLRVHAIFGADDPNKPDCSSVAKTGPGLEAVDIPGEDHDVYRRPDVCAASLDRFLSGPPLRSAGPAAPP